MFGLCKKGKDLKKVMAVKWVLALVLFYLLLVTYPQKSDLVLFGYLAVMFGLTWKFLYKMHK